MNEKTIEDALNLLISGELDLVDTALGEVSNIKTYAEAGILTRDSGLVLRMEDGSEFQITFSILCHLPNGAGAPKRPGPVLYAADISDGRVVIS